MHCIRETFVYLIASSFTGELNLVLGASGFGFGDPGGRLSAEAEETTARRRTEAKNLFIFHKDSKFFSLLRKSSVITPLKTTVPCPEEGGLLL